MGGQVGTHMKNQPKSAKIATKMSQLPISQRVVPPLRKLQSLPEGRSDEQLVSKAKVKFIEKKSFAKISAKSKLQKHRPQALQTLPSPPYDSERFSTPKPDMPKTLCKADPSAHSLITHHQGISVTPTGAAAVSSLPGTPTKPNYSQHREQIQERLVKTEPRSYEKKIFAKKRHYKTYNKQEDRKYGFKKAFGVDARAFFADCEDQCREIEELFGKAGRHLAENATASTKSE